MNLRRVEWRFRVRDTVPLPGVDSVGRDVFQHFDVYPSLSTQITYISLTLLYMFVEASA